MGNGVLATSKDGTVTFCQLVPWQFDALKQMNLKRTFRRAAFLVTRLASNMGAASSTPLLDSFIRPLGAVADGGRARAPSRADEKRWLSGLYLDTPEEWDDPYRYFEW